MKPFDVLHGEAVCLTANNIDTDQLIPARFMSRTRAQGYGDALLHDSRYTQNGERNESFVLNRFPNASVLVAGDNFGSGSSREAAVYALVDSGIHVVISTSFADIFYKNAVNNGLLPAILGTDEHAALLQLIGSHSQAITVTLPEQTIHVRDQSTSFDITLPAKEKLMNGWDDIDLTQAHNPAIEAFTRQRCIDHPWAYPSVDKV